MSGGRLAEDIRAAILADGPMTVARYMAMCLAHPTLGYYMTRDPLGRQGDFTTAPEISQMFGELLGLWAAHAWVEAGRPRRVALVELGPGRGTLMKDAMRAVSRAAPAFAQAASLHLVETSPVLRRAQVEALAGYSPTWHEGIETLPDGPMIVLANEFFDALPIRQFVRGEGVWRERLVGIGEGRLVYLTSPQPLPQDLLPAAPEGAVVEVCEAGAAIVATLSRRMAREGGAALLVDYGHLVSAFGDTLQAVKGHAYVDPLDAPGEADLTAHVDFSAFARAAEAEGASVELVASQADFLEALGIRARSEAIAARATAEQAAELRGQLARLTDRDERGMGSLFKVMALSGGIPAGRPPADG